LLPGAQDRHDSAVRLPQAQRAQLGKFVHACANIDRIARGRSGPTRSGSSFTCWRTTNFLRTLALPGEIAAWSLTILREKVVKIGAKVVAHGRLVLPDGGGGGARGSYFRGVLDLIGAVRLPVVARS
jgi:hypothetical protein